MLQFPPQKMQKMPQVQIKFVILLFVHALVVPEENMDGKNNQVVAEARGDGTIEIIDLRFESHMTGAKSKQSSRARKGFQSKSSKITNVNENIAGGYYKE